MLSLAAQLGLENALEEITLVFFTTLGPSAALGYLLVTLAWAEPGTTRMQRAFVRRQLWIPLVLCMLGLVASATHLGSPENALYVLTHVGESPLSNEVFVAVVFLASAALFWMLNFTTDEHRGIDFALMVAVTASGLACIAAISFAYNVTTIVTWSQPCVPASIAASALVGGAPIALATLKAAKARPWGGRYARVLAGAFVLGGCAWLALVAFYGSQLGAIGNSLFTASELVPCYWPCFAAAVVLLVAAFAAGMLPGLRGRQPGPVRLSAATLLALAAIFLMRFMFYATHMTVGLTI